MHWFNWCLCINIKNISTHWERAPNSKGAFHNIIEQITHWVGCYWSFVQIAQSPGKPFAWWLRNLDETSEAEPTQCVICSMCLCISMLFFASSFVYTVIAKKYSYAEKNRTLAISEAQWPIGYSVGLWIKRSSVRIQPWPLRWVLGQGSLLPLSQGEAFTLASISYLAILVKYILAKKKKFCTLIIFEPQERWTVSHTPVCVHGIRVPLKFVLLAKKIIIEIKAHIKISAITVQG